MEGPAQSTTRSVLLINIIPILDLNSVQDNLIFTPELLMDNVGVFCNCIFSNNSSPTGGSTISMVSNTRVDQASTPTTFTNWYVQSIPVVTCE